MEFNQQTSTPFQADTLQSAPGPLELVEAWEFGTNVTDDVGDAYNTEAVPSGDPGAFIDARLGALSLQVRTADGNVPESRGRSYPFPALAKFTEQVNFGPGIRLALVLAKVWLRELGSDLNAPYADFIIAPDTFVGNRPVDPYAACVLQGPVAAAPADLYSAGLNEYAAGGSLPATTVLQTGPYMNPGALYVRCFVNIDEVAGTCTTQVALSQDGVSFLGRSIANALNFLPGRWAFGVRGQVVAALDWVRIFNAPLLVPGVNFDWTFLPAYPVLNGGRLFVR